jgi:glycosyltransferase involved in cell wall biosynthesis
VRTPEGAAWSDGPATYAFWSRYLDVFDEVNVVARVADTRFPAPGLRQADGPGVTFSGVPSYLGPVQYLWRAPRIGRAVRRGLSQDDAVILTVPGQIANCMEARLAEGRPYTVQVVGDPLEVFAPGVIRHPLRPIFRWWFCRKLKGQVARADGALYVTQRTLQARYPCRGSCVGVSDVELGDDAIAHAPRKPPAANARTIIGVGTMAQLYKGHDTLIEAVAECVRQGRDLRLVLVGDGQHRPMLEDQARRAGLGERVRFRGQVPAGADVRRELDGADLFALPSRTEGLPRALVEAMAHGLPCIASCVGGIPELLEAEDLVSPGDPAALARKIAECVSNPERMQSMSARNLRVAGEFRAESLRLRRTEFYRFVADETEAWRNRSRLPGHGASRGSPQGQNA